MSEHPQSPDQEDIRKSVLDLMPEPLAFSNEDNLLELGLDSIKIMMLVSTWRRLGFKVGFAELIVDPRLCAWHSLLKQAAVVKRAPAPLADIRDSVDIAPMAPFPLTDVQYAYWFGRRDDQPMGGRGCHAYLELDGREVEPKRLQAAWNLVLGHHSMLRVRFLTDGNQEILPRAPHEKVEVLDLRNCAEDEVASALDELRRQRSHRRLAVEAGEVAGLALSLLPDERTRLHLDIDLLVADVQSLHIILRDLTAAYSRKCPPPAPADWRFGLYLQEEKMRRHEEHEQARRYWQERLADLPGAPGLPLRQEPETLRNPVFSRRTHLLPAQDWNHLQKLAASHQLTPAMVMMSAYAQILGRFSDTPNFLLNIPLFDRHTEHPGLDQVVADFTNLLLLAVDLNKTGGFLDHTLRLRERFHQDVAHAAYSGVQVQRDLARLRQGERMLAPVVFASNLGTPLLSEECRNHLGELHYMISQTPQVWLDCQLYETPEGLLLAWDAVDEIFPDGLIDQMFMAYTSLLSWLVAKETDWQEMPEIFFNPCRPEKEPVCLAEHAPPLLHAPFFQQAARQPGALALIDDGQGREISYGELAGESLSLAGKLQFCGVQPGDLVAVCLPRGTEQIVAVLAILACGAAYAPVGPDQPPARRAEMLGKAGIGYVLTNTEGALASAWPEETILLTTDTYDRAAPLAEPVNVSPDTLAYLIFTSGSTGAPKGVEISHQAACATLAAVHNLYGISAEDRLLALAALDFDLSVYDIFGMLGQGASLVLIGEERRRDPRYWLHLIRRHRVTVWNSVPILLSMLLFAVEEEKEKNLPLRLALLSGDWIGLDLPERLQKAAPDCQMVALGGATEAAIWSNHLPVSPPLPPEWRSIPYGRPLPGQAYRVVDSLGRDCPDWVSGELWIGGCGVALGYRGEPDLSASRFVSWQGERWYRTGDLGRYWPDGTLEFLGRQDFQMKIRGHRIEPGEIEQALKSHAMIREAVVVAEQTEQGRRLACHVVPHGTQGLDFRELADFLRLRLPEYMVPAAWLVLDALPLSANGKLDRKLLPSCKVEQTTADGGQAPQDELEAKLAAIWQEILHLPSIGREENFFALGGDSLSALQVISRVKRDLQTEIPMDLFFRQSDIASLANYIRASGFVGASQIKPDPLPEIIPDLMAADQPFPLTDVQHAYWIGRIGAYWLGQVASHITFELDNEVFELERLQAAWQLLMERHPMLRMRVLPDGRQVIGPPADPVYFPLSDLCGLDPERTEVELASIRTEMAGQVLSTEQGPLFDIRLARYNGKQGPRMRLYLDFDSLIADASSLFLLLEEWWRLYQQPDLQLPPLTLSFRDYVLAEARLNKSAVYQRDKAYWRARLSELPPAPELPLVRPPVLSSQPQTIRRSATLPPPVWQRLQQGIRRAGLSSATFLIAAYAEVLGRWSKSQHFTLNITTFQRLPLHEQVNEVVGDFTSLLLLLVDNRDAAPFLDRVRRLQWQLWQDLEHRLYGGVQVLRDLAAQQKKREMLIPVVFTGALNLEDRDASALSRMGRLISSSTQTPQVWLDHQTYEQDGALVLNWDSVDALFPEHMIDDMFASYTNLLKRLAEEESLWMRPNPLELPETQRQARQYFNATTAPASKDTLTDLFVRQTALSPDTPALISADRSLSYRELIQRARSLAGRLQQHGAGSEKLVAVLMEKGWQQGLAQIAVSMTGAAWLPLDPHLPEERLRSLLHRAGVHIALSQSSLLARLPLPEQMISIAVDAETLKDAAPAPRISGQGKSKNLAYVIYTSGSTGEPKGVAIEQGAAVNTILDINERFQVGPQDRILGLSNLNFDLSVYDFWGAWAAGAALVLPGEEDRRNPAVWLALLREHRVSIWNTVPALMQMLVLYTMGQGEKLPASLRLVLLSGDWIPLDLPAQIRALAPQARVISLGGATEASIWSVLYPIDQVAPNWASIPYGRPMRNQGLHVLNSWMEPCPDHVPGELYISGLGLAREYWRDPERTAASFPIHPRSGERLYRTGDWGRFLPEGLIEFLGREDLQIKIRGYRIELGEIESALKEHPSLQEALVVAKGKNAAERQLVAFVLPAPGCEVSTEKLRAFLTQKLPEYMLPARIERLGSLPLSANGKVDRAALLQRAEQLAAPRVKDGQSAQPPSSELERRILAIWRELLETDSIGTRDNFFDLGGTSLLAVSLHQGLVRELGRDFPLVTVFTCPTIQSQATYLAGTGDVAGNGAAKRRIALRRQHQNSSAWQLARRKKEAPQLDQEASITGQNHA